MTNLLEAIWLISVRASRQHKLILYHSLDSRAYLHSFPEGRSFLLSLLSGSLLCIRHHCPGCVSACVKDTSLDLSRSMCGASSS